MKWYYFLVVLAPHRIFCSRVYLPDQFWLLAHLRDDINLNLFDINASPLLLENILDTKTVPLRSCYFWEEEV